MTPFTVAVTVTVSDQVEFLDHLLRRPDIRWRRLALYGGAIVLGPAAGIVLGFMTGYLTDARAGSLGDALARFDWRDALSTTLPVVGALAAVAVVIRLFRRPILARRLRRPLRDRPGVDPRDPELREHATVTFTDRGYTVALTGSTHEVSWTVVRGLAEIPALLALMTGRLTGNLLPKRDMSPGQQATLRALVAERVSVRPR